jgi:hypothetical protein
VLALRLDGVAGRGGDVRDEREELSLGNRELEGHHVEELTLDSADIGGGKDLGALCPVLVLEGRVIRVLGSHDKGAKEDAFAGPILECNLEVALGTLDVGEGKEDCCHGCVGIGEDARDEVVERLILAMEGAAARWAWS